MFDITKCICNKCKSTPKYRDGGLDSNFISCECKGENGGYKIVIYAGWGMPKEWELINEINIPFPKITISNSTIGQPLTLIELEKFKEACGEPPVGMKIVCNKYFEEKTFIIMVSPDVYDKIVEEKK